MNLELYKQRIKDLRTKTDTAWENLRKVEDCKCHECYPLIQNALDHWYELTTKKDRTIRNLVNKLHATGLNWSKISKLIDIDYNMVFRQGSYGGRLVLRSVKYTVKTRDKNKCRACKSKDRLQVHHIFDSKNHKKENLLTLCIPCHTFIEKFKRYDKETYKILITPYYTKNCR